MARIKLGVSLKSLPWPLRRSLQEVRKLGVAGVELEIKGDLSPQNLSQTGRRELRHLLSSNNLEASALYCPLRRGLDIAENQQARIDYLRQVLTLSFELGPRIVVVPAGKVPEKEDDPHFVLMQGALESLGRHGDKVGAALALDTGLESGEALKTFLDRFDTAGLAVHFNPGQLLLGGFNPYESARALGPKIVHAVAQDARAVSPNRTQPVGVGHGDIEWLQMLATFGEIEYKGFLIVPGESVAELAAGVSLLRRLTGGSSA